MNLLKIGLLIAGGFGLLQLNAQSEVVVKYNNDAELWMNDLNISSSTKISEIRSEIGEEDTSHTKLNGETMLRYEQLGLVVILKEDKMSGFALNMNWDGDKDFPKTSFPGKLMIGEKHIQIDSKSADVGSIEGIAFMCPFPLMCVSEDREADVKCAIAFKDEIMSQVVFLLDHQSR